MSSPFQHDVYVDGAAGGTPITAAKMNRAGVELDALDTLLLYPTGTKTAAYTAAVKDDVLCDATSGGFTVTLPAAPVDGSEVMVKKLDNTSNIVTVACGGTDTYAVGGTTLALAVQGHAATFRYQASTGHWITVSNDLPWAPLAAGALSATYARVIGVPAPTGVSATDTANIQAALNLVPASGAEVRLQWGVYAVNSGGLTCANPVTIVGAGSGSHLTGGTRIQVTSATADALYLSGVSSQVRDLTIERPSFATSRSTAGSGIRAANAEWMHLTRVLVSGFWNNIQIDAGDYYTITDCVILDFANYGVYTNNPGVNFDWGVPTVTGTIITKYRDTVNGGTCFRWESGGGIQIANCYINSGPQPSNPSTGTTDYGLDFQVADGGSTSVLRIVGTSVENNKQAGIRVGQKGPSNTGQFGKIVITGCEIACFDQVASRGIDISPAVTGNIGDGMISGNVITDTYIGISISNTSGIHIGPNHMVRVSTGVRLSGSANSDYNVTMPTFVGSGVLQLDQGAGNVSTHLKSGQRQLAVAREVPATTSNTVYTNLYRLLIPAYSAGIINLTIAGAVTGVGAFLWQASRIYSLGASGNVAMTTVGTDVTSGATVDVAFDVTTQSGYVIVKIKLNVAGGTDIYASAQMSYTGPCVELYKY